MADDTTPKPGNLQFHPCDSPRGMLYFNLDMLTDYQKFRIKEHKINFVRQNQQYLNDHPEIRVMISVFVKAYLKARPKIKLQHFLVKYLSENWSDLDEMIRKYTRERKRAEEEHVTDRRQTFLEYFDVEKKTSPPKFDEADDSLMDIVMHSNKSDDHRPEKPSDHDVEKISRNVLESIVDTIPESVEEQEFETPSEPATTVDVKDDDSFVFIFPTQLSDSSLEDQSLEKSDAY